jgi:hypothetical protein
VSLKDFYQNQKLKDFFSPLSLSLDKEGKVRKNGYLLASAWSCTL